MKFSDVILSAFFVFFFSCNNHAELIQNPSKGDIYLFEEGDLYYPILVVDVKGDSVFCVNSKFKFADAKPEMEDMPIDEFDYDFQLIYEINELVRLTEESNIVEVYRNE